MSCFFGYWRSNYGRLLDIKKLWDPNNALNHCHNIVGSTDEDCCDDSFYRNKNESN